MNLNLLVFGATFIGIGAALPLLVLYALWGWPGLVAGGLVAVSSILGACCVLVGLRLVR